eukprot:gene41705-50900_t
MRNSLKVTTNKSFFEDKGAPDKELDDPENALLRLEPTPSSVIAEVKSYREGLVGLSGVEDFEPNVLANMPVSPSDFEELLEDALDLQRIADPNLHRIKAIYPPQALSSSSVQDLSPVADPDAGEDRDWGAFMSVIQGAYTSKNSSTPSNSPATSSEDFKAILITKDQLGVHSFLFDQEAQYWAFLAAIKRARGQQGVASLEGGDGSWTMKGECRYLPPGAKNAELSSSAASGAKKGGMFGLRAADAHAPTLSPPCAYTVTPLTLTLSPTPLTLFLGEVRVLVATKDACAPQPLLLQCEVEAADAAAAAPPTPLPPMAARLR